MLELFLVYDDTRVENLLLFFWKYQVASTCRGIMHFHTTWSMLVCPSLSVEVIVAVTARECCMEHRWQPNDEKVERAKQM